MGSGNQEKLALLGGVPVRPADKLWPAWPVFDDAERTAVAAVLESGKWFYGERVKQFEQEFAAFQDARFCVSCNSGTAALEIALQARGIGPGDEVIIPPYTFVATASAVLRVGAIPVFVDIDKAWCLDPPAIEAAITSKTRAIVPVHFGGRICDMDRINALAEKLGLIVIEDACHSWGGKWEGKGTGALGLGGVFSFQMSKNITAGEGGAILTDHEGFADQCRSISNCGRHKNGPWYHHINVGTNARMTEWAAAILSVQLSRLEDQTMRREQNAAWLNTELSGIEGLSLQPNSNRITRRAYHLYCLRIDPDTFGCDREQFVNAANAEGLPISAGYPLPLYKQPVFKNIPGYDYAKCSCPVAEDICYRSGMWFAHQLLLGAEADMQDIVTIVRKIKAHSAALKKT